MEIYRMKTTFVALLAIVALAGGIAWAAQSESITLPCADRIVVDAVLMPGDLGAVCLAKFADEEELSIDFDEQGFCTIAGGHCSIYEPVHQHSIRIDLRETADGWLANVVVRDDDMGTVVNVARDIEMGVSAPQSAFASGELVMVLSAN